MSFMLEEICETPEAIRRVKMKNERVIVEIAREFKTRGLSNVTTVARGTSDNAATYFKYVSEIAARVPVSKYLPSVTTVYGERPDFRHNMLVAISQSGRSTDTLLALKAAKEQGALTVAVTNDAGSSLATEADYHIFLAAGEEKSVSATKTFLTQLTALTMLAYAISDRPDGAPDVEKIASLLQNFIADKKDDLCALADRSKEIANVPVLSRGLLQGTANELAMKLIETSYVFSRPFSTSDFMHGPLAVVTEGTDVILLAPSGKMEAEFVDIATRLNLLGARLIAFTDVKKIAAIAADSAEMPDADEAYQPFLYATAIQLFSEQLSKSKGLNPDVPRNLKKVTITR